MSILNNFLKKIGRNYEQLNTPERDVYKRWEKQLNETGKPITIDKLIKFLEKEIEIELTSLLTPGLSKEQDLFLKANLKNNRMLLAYLQSPAHGRDVLRQYLEEKLENIKQK